MLPGVTAFPCHHLCAERWRMSGSSFRFQHFHHLVGCGVGCALLEEAGNGKDGVAHRSIVKLLKERDDLFFTPESLTEELEEMCIPQWENEATIYEL